MLPGIAQESAEPGYAEFAARLVATGILSDPWLDGKPRFRRAPLVLSATLARALADAAAGLAGAFDALARLCAADPSLVDELRVTPFQRVMWDAAAPLWHGIARADVFRVSDGADGIRICEINCDTPSGEAEAVLTSAVSAVENPRLVDPNGGLGARLCDVVAGYAAACGLPRGGRPLVVGILYPTEITEDLSMIRLYERWFAGRGWRVVLGSPFNLRRVGDAGAALFDTRCDVFVRHYKTDWWGERLPVRDDDEPFADAEALARPLRILVEAQLAGECAVVNPLGAVVLQNKRAMALLCEHVARLPSEAADAVRRFLPETRRLETCDRARLAVEKDDWVLKSDYGCEGAEVVIGRDVGDEEWRDVLAHAIPTRWVAQRAFVPMPETDGGASINYGVYVVGGVPSGFFARIARGATDTGALTAPVLVEEELP